MIVFSIHVCCVFKHVAVISVSLFFSFLGFWYLPVASLSWHIKLCLQGLKPFAELILVSHLYFIKDYSYHSIISVFIIQFSSYHYQHSLTNFLGIH